MTPDQKQALFTLRQALVMCEAAGIEIVAACGPVWLDEMCGGEPDVDRLTSDTIDEFEKELGE